MVSNWKCTKDYIAKHSPSNLVSLNHPVVLPGSNRDHPFAWFFGTWMKMRLALYHFKLWNHLAEKLKTFSSPNSGQPIMEHLPSSGDRNSRLQRTHYSGETQKTEFQIIWQGSKCSKSLQLRKTCFSSTPQVLGKARLAQGEHSPLIALEPGASGYVLSLPFLYRIHSLGQETTWAWTAAGLPTELPTTGLSQDV